MRSRKIIFLFMVSVLLVNGCGLVVMEPSAPTVEKQPTYAPTSTLIPTLTPIELPTLTPTNTPEPTDIPTPTLTPTPTTVPTPKPVEWDVDPYIVKEIEGEYRGVTIKGRFIVDRSLEDIVESVEINDNVFAEMIAKMLATLWYAREKSEPYRLAKPPELNDWIDLWAKAQETGSEYYWSQVQLNNIWANDLNDGNGYSEKSYNFWPMYEGTTTYGVVGIDKITIVILDVTKTGAFNFDTFPGSIKTKLIGGTNLDNQNLIIYVGRDTKASVANIFDLYGNEYTQDTATQFALQTNLVIPIDFLISNDANFTFEHDTVAPSSLWGTIKRAIKYEKKGE